MALLVAGGCAKFAAAPARPPGQIAFREIRLASGGRAPFGIVAADFDRDGSVDLAVTNSGGGSVAVFSGDGRGGFASRGTWPVTGAARGVTAADLNRDGNLDLVVAPAEAADVTILLGDGKASFQSSKTRSGVAPFASDVCDLDGDGSPDIVVANETNVGSLKKKGDVSVLFGDGSGRFSRAVSLEAGLGPADAKCADLDGDGHRDIAVVNWATSDIMLFMGRGQRRFESGATVPLSGDPAYSIAVADMDGDGRLDIVAADVMARVNVFANRGGAFELSKTLTAGRGARSVIAVDLNRDKVLDLVTADTAADTASVLLGKGGGEFVPPVAIGVGRRPRSVAAGDVDNDGWQDVVITNAGSDGVSILMNLGAGK